MADKTELLRRRAEKAAAAENEAGRQRKAAEAALREQERKDDTHFTILAGHWALARARDSEEFRTKFLREMEGYWLVQDKDRAAYGFEPLPGEERERRNKAFATQINRGRRWGKDAWPQRGAARDEDSPQPGNQRGGENVDTSARETEAA